MNESGMRSEDEMPDHYWDGWVAFSMGGHPLRMREYPPKKKPENFYADWDKDKWMYALSITLTNSSWSYMWNSEPFNPWGIGDKCTALMIEPCFTARKFLEEFEKGFEHKVMGEDRGMFETRLAVVFSHADSSGMDSPVWLFTNIPALVSDLADVFMKAVQNA